MVSRCGKLKNATKAASSHRQLIIKYKFMSQEHPHLGGFALLPPKPGTCATCATKHAAELPHNQQSLFYQYNFYGQTGRWPTWVDAMAHCSEPMKAEWIKALRVRGVEVAP